MNAVQPSTACVPSSTDRREAANCGWPKRWQTLGQGLGVGRYTDKEFAQLEFDKLWSRVWQVAARMEEVPQPGDYTTYSIGDQSVLVVRVDADTVKAYYNFCPHRGTALGDGCGHFDKGRIVCPFHGWRWDLEGKIQLVLGREEFAGGKLQDQDVAMREVHSAVCGGFVFINLANSPQPFDEFIAPMRAFLEDFVLADMQHVWWKQATIPCNWKVAQEAFFEAYHVSATHPQLEKVGSEIVYGDRTDGEMMFENLTYITTDQGHGYFYGGEKTPMAGHVQGEVRNQNELIDAMAARMNLTAEGLQAMILPGDIELVLSLKDKNLPENANVGAEYVKLQYETAARLGRPMPKLTPEHVGKWGGVNFIFPNLLILPQAGNAAIYRSRPHPTDPDQCIFEIRSVTTLPAGETGPRAEVQQVTNPQQELGLIPQQDLSNLPRIQVGLHSKGMKQVWLAEYQEQLILNMHREVDRYLQAD